jgi:hypothetical protein
MVAFFVFLNFFGMDYYPPQADKGSSTIGGLRYKNLKRLINGRFFCFSKIYWHGLLSALGGQGFIRQRWTPLQKFKAIN